ncbi:MAG TPA: class I SAM-dependent methyltransferase [Geminicoccaceae bacterium]|nr:class I SAM-dependent methyltransferase [Geminicoccaceae bacterium]
MTEWDAKGYDEVDSLQKWIADKHLARLDLAGSERVLDIGCGEGKISAEIAQRLANGSVLGVDRSTRMISFARSHFPRSACPNLAFEIADATTLPYRAAFDLVVSFNALHWVRDQDAALRGVRAALKENGRTFLQFVPQGERRCLEDVIEETCASGRWDRYFGERHQPPYLHLTPEEYAGLAERNGLRVERLERELCSWDFGGREGLARWADVTFVEWTKSIPKGEHAAFIADVLDRYERVDETGRPGLFQFYQMEAVLRPAGAT